LDGSGLNRGDIVVIFREALALPRGTLRVCATADEPAPDAGLMGA